MAIAVRHFPNLLKASQAERERFAKGLKQELRAGSKDAIEAARAAAEPELDVIEVDNTIRNSWMAIYAIQEDITTVQKLMDGAIRRGEVSQNDGNAAIGKVNAAVRSIITTSPTSITGAALVSPSAGRIPFINTALQLNGGTDAPEYNSSTKALTIRGALNITGVSTLTGNVIAKGTLTVTGAVSLASTLAVTGNTTLSGTLAVTGAVTLTVPLAVPQGGTGAATFTDGGLMLGSGTGILTVLAQATNGQLPIGTTGSDPTLATITGTANEITVGNGAGSITLSLPATLIQTGSLKVTTSLEVDGDLNHDGANVGFFGTAPAVQAGAYTRNATIVEDRTLLASASATTLNNNNVLAALIADLKSYGLIQ